MKHFLASIIFACFLYAAITTTGKVISDAKITTYVNGWENRYYIINGEDVVQVGKHMYDSYVKQGACTQGADKKMYPEYKVIIHRCYV